jgi:hypothetical protein
MAPGNRDQTVIIEPKTIDAIMLNIGNALIPGVATDYATGAMFMYPEIVSIDFRGIPPKPMPLPAYHNKDVIPPMQKGLEEFMPSHPSLSSDSEIPKATLRKRGEADAAEAEVAEPEQPVSEGQQKANELTEQYNPWIFERGDAGLTPEYDPAYDSYNPEPSGPPTSFPVEPMTGDSPPVQLYLLD